MKNIIFVIITTVVVLGFYGLVLGYDNNLDEFLVYYDEITIESGDTIWSIASKYSDGRIDINKYCDEIMKINNMKSDKIISGHRIIVPIYK